MKNLIRKENLSIVTTNGQRFAKPADVIDQSNVPMNNKVRHASLSALRQRARDQGASIKTDNGEHVNLQWLEENMDIIISEMSDRDAKKTGTPRTMERRHIKDLEHEADDLKVLLRWYEIKNDHDYQDRAIRIEMLKDA